MNLNQIFTVYNFLIIDKDLVVIEYMYLNYNSTLLEYRRIQVHVNAPIFTNLFMTVILFELRCELYLTHLYLTVS